MTPAPDLDPGTIHEAARGSGNSLWNLVSGFVGMVSAYLASHGFRWAKKRRRDRNIDSDGYAPPEALRTHDEIRDIREEAREDGKTQVRLDELERQSKIHFEKYEALRDSQLETQRQLTALTALVGGVRSDLQVFITALLGKGKKKRRARAPGGSNG